MSSTISLGLAANWLEKLTKQFFKNRSIYKEEEGKIADELLLVPQELVPQFIEPDLLTINPADGLEDEDDEHNRVPAFRYIESFFKSKKRNHSQRVMFILADAGMGKTSLLAMLKIAQLNDFWLTSYKCLALKLGDETLEKIKEIENKNRTVLLLDSLDEDPKAFGRTKERVQNLLTKTEGFYRVIITCRSQFLPLGDLKLFPTQDRIKILDYSIQVRYLAPFNEVQVDKYLENLFGKKRTLLGSKKAEKHESALKILRRIDNLQCRPLILSYVPDIIDQEFESNIFGIYRTILSRWLDREQRKQPDTITKNTMLSVAIQLAVYMTLQNTRFVSKNFLTQNLPSNESSQLSAVSIGGKSLLNKNADGNYLFSHKSFQEFLVVFAMSKGLNVKPHRVTELELSFHQCLRAAKIKGCDLSGLTYKQLNLARASAGGADFSETNLPKSNFSNAGLSKASFKNARLEKADFSGACLVGADFSGANLINANFESADLREANLSGANLGGASLRDAIFIKCDLTRTAFKLANATGADFSSALLKHANFKNSVLDSADFCGADLEYTKFDKQQISSRNLVRAVNIDKAKDLLQCPF